MPLYFHWTTAEYNNQAIRSEVVYMKAYILVVENEWMMSDLISYYKYFLFKDTILLCPNEL